MATQTTNLGLKKPDGTDYVLVADLNSNMDVVDNMTGKLSNLLTSAKTNLVAAINEAAVTGGTNAPYVGDNLNWYEWDAMTSRYVDANISAQGVQMQTGTVITGVSTIPAVYATGIAYAKKYDLYLNISTHNVYQCATEGNAATATWKYLTNIKGATGFSPSADISKSGNIATINITDELGRTTATVMDGTDGISPQASVAAISGGARITITDANGTTAQNVMDGADGKGNNWYTGNAITGTSITPSVYATGIANAFAGDMYLNSGALPNTGREYVCTTGGNDSTALWKYNALLRGADGQGTGDMLKSTYDHDSDGIVDDAERLGGNLPSYYAAAKNIPAAQIQSDWNQSAATALSFINNKPTLGSLAAKNTISTDDISDSIVIDCKLAKMSAITLKGNASTNIATPADLTAAQVRTMLNVVDGADATGTALELTTAIDAIADADKIIIEDVSAAAGLQTKHVLWSSIKTALNAVFASLTHAARHASGGADAITPANIGAAPTAHNQAIDTITGLTEALATKADKPTIVAATLTTTWTGTAAPYTQTVAVAGVTANNIVVVELTEPSTADQRAAARAAMITWSQSAGQLTATADGTKPTIALPITVCAGVGG